MNPERKSYPRYKSHAPQILTASATMLLLRCLLDLLYVSYVDRFFPDSFGAGLFRFDGLDLGRFVESYAVAFGLGVWLIISLSRRCRPSGIALILYFVGVVLPLTSLYGLVDVPACFMYAVVGCFSVLIMIADLLPRVRVPRPSRELVDLGMIAIIGVSIYVYGQLALTGGLARLNLDLLSVYAVRSEYTSNYAPLFGYFVPWQANLFNMLLLCYALHKRSIMLIVLATTALLLLFGMTGFKSFLLAPLLAAGVYVVWGRKNALFCIFSGVIALVAVSYATFWVTGNHLVSSMLIRRLLFVPASNHILYYDFFSNPSHSFVLLSNSILEPFVQYPYDMSITRVISWAYWGRDFGPNAGYLADAFAHFGLAGMLGFSIILGLFLRTLDSVAKSLPSNLVAAIVAVPCMALVNSALLTSLLTHGLIPALFVIWLLRAIFCRRNDEDKKANADALPVAKESRGE
ncbi:hypothetical protein ACFLSW_01725 [Candidatus Bipolaricaulota bacterium]